MASSESYEPPCEMHQPSSVTHCDQGSWHQHEMALSPKYHRRSPPASSSEGSLKNPFSSSSSSSSSFLCSSLCLSHLKYLDLPSPWESPPTSKDSLEAILDSPTANELALSVFPERTGSGSCLDVSDSSTIKEKAESKSLKVLLFTERQLQTEILPPFAEQSRSQPLASFAQINILQSYEKEDHIVLVEKSLSICTGRVPAHKAECSLPPQPPPAAQEEEEEEEKEEPKLLSFMDQMSLQLINENIKHKHRSATSLQDLLVNVKSTIQRAISQAGQDSGQDIVSASTSSRADLVALSCTQENVGEEARHFLEFHVKKKMIQRQCGIPTIVIKSLKVFHALASQFPGEFVVSSSQMPKQKPTFVLMDTERPLLLVSPPLKPMAIAANHLKKIPRKKEYTFLHSLEPEEIRKLAFHTSVKMLEIKMGTFPDIVEKSFQIFGILSENPLPKMIHFGNKIQRLKHPSLPFLAREALCIIELNIKHKCLACTGKHPLLYMNSATKITCGSLEPRELAEDITERVSEKPFIATSAPESCPKEGALCPALSELPAAPESQNQPGSFSSSSVTCTTSSSLEPEDSSRNRASKTPCISKQLHFPEATILESCPKEKVPCPDLRGLSPVPESQQSSHSLSSSLVTMLTSSSSEPRGPEDEPTKGVSNNLSISQAVHTQEVSIPQPPPGIRALPPTPESRDSSCSLSSPLVTAMTSSSFSSTLVPMRASSSPEPRWPEEEDTKDMSEKASQEGHFQETTIPEPCPALRELSPVAKPQESSQSLSSALVIPLTCSSSEPRGPQDDPTKRVPKNLSILRAVHFQDVPISESCPGSRELLPVPKSQESSHSLSSAFVTLLTPSSSEPIEPPDDPTEHVSKNLSVSHAVHTQEVNIPAASPGIRALLPAPESRHSSHSLSSPLVTAMTSSSFSSTLVPMRASSSPEPRWPEEEDTKDMSEKACISQEGHFQETTIPGPCPALRELSPVAKPQESSQSLSSALVTPLTPSSSKQRGPQDDPTKGVPKNLSILRAVHFQDVPISESCPGSRELLPVPKSQESSHSLSSAFVTLLTPSSSEQREPPDDPTERVSKNLSVSHAVHTQEVNIPEASSGIRALLPAPESRHSSHSLSSPLVTAMTSSSFSSALVPVRASSSPEPRGPEEEHTKDMSEKACISQEGHFQETTIPGLCPALRELSPVTKPQESSQSPSSALATPLKPSSSEPKGPQDDPTKGVPKNLSILRAVHFQDVPISELCPGSKELLPVPKSQESSHSLSSALVTPLTSSSPEPRGPPDDPTKGVSKNPSISQALHFQEATIPVPCPGSKELPPISKSQESSQSHPIPAGRPEESTTKEVSNKTGIPQPLQFQEVTIPEPCPGLKELPPVPKSQESSQSHPVPPGGPEESTTKEVSKKTCIPRPLHFQEVTIPEPCPGLRGLTPVPETKDSSHSLSSPLVTVNTCNSLSPALATTMTPSSSKPRGPEQDVIREVSKRPCISQEAHLHELTLPEPRSKEKVPCPDLRERPTAPESSRLLCPQLVTAMTSSSTEPRGLKDDTTKEVSKKICVSRELHFREISVLETFRKEETPGSGLREPSERPDSQKSSSSLSSALVSAAKLSEAYLKYVVSKKSSAHSVPSETEKTLENSPLPKPLSTDAKEGSGTSGERKKNEKAAEVGGKGTRMEREAKADEKRSETEKAAEADGKGTKTEKGVEGEGKGREETGPKGCTEEEGPITRTSIFLELELKKEKLNLHLKKKIETHLQPQQRAAMELSVDVDKAPSSRKAKKAARRPSSLGPEAQGKPCRPFCYVCMPLDDTGSTVKTVCWALPKWILEMNGYRVPQVARFEKKPKGPGPAAK